MYCDMDPCTYYDMGAIYGDRGAMYCEMEAMYYDMGAITIIISIHMLTSQYMSQSQSAWPNVIVHAPLS